MFTCKLSRHHSAVQLLAAIVIAAGLFASSTLLATAIQAATLHFSPSTLTVGVAQTAELQLIASSTVAINSVQVTVAYPTNLVLGVEATAKGTVFPITVFPATVDNTQGRATFTVSVPTPGYTGSTGVVGTLTFRGQKLGEGQITVVSAKIIANDGSGTNTYTSSTPANLVVDNSVNPQYTTPGVRGPVPIVNSPSHPDPAKWYQERSVQFTWSGGGAQGYSWVFDQNPDTLAPEQSMGTSTSTTINGVGDGTWYIHVRAQADNVWGPTTTFRVQIDGSPPGAFQLELDPSNTDNPSALPLITFEAPDSQAGIDYYELILDDAEPVKTRSPYQLPKLPSGQHTIQVWAVDKAGNRTMASTTLNLVPLSPKPVITDPSTNFTIEANGKVSGTGPPNTTMQLYANDKFIMAVDVDDQGNFSFDLANQLKAGQYTFKVKAVKSNHLDSEFSDSIEGTVKEGGLMGGLGGFGTSLTIGGIQIPMWVTIVLYIIILLLLIALLIYLYYRWRKARREQKLAMQKLELMTAPDPTSNPIATNVGQEGQTPIATIQPVPTSPSPPTQPSTESTQTSPPTTPK